MTLKEYLKAHPYRGPFKPGTRQHPHAAVTYFRGGDERAYTVQVCDKLDVFVGMTTGNIVGFQVWDTRAAQ